ncbi:hypothetical protein FSP39_010275 [Pinctada imbricata]|uniref:Uncharacterized protein n=1 Tax=Pinctada imbricata TaxID=66713 RepID=A0AA88Y649_PINIB|nr:hypothetical protein FSP39_010275 [Pinctada imbricata]
MGNWCRLWTAFVTQVANGVVILDYVRTTLALLQLPRGLEERGTFDITVSQVTQEGLEEIHRANGGNVGGTTVNKEFWNLLCRVYGEDVVSRFRSEDPDDELRLEQSFEQTKKSVEMNDKRGDIHMPIPLALHTIFTAGKTIEKSDQQWKPKEFEGKIIVDLKKGKLQINRRVFENLFRTSFDEIYKSISELLSKQELSNLNAILMVGGFSDSPLLYEKMKAHIHIDHPNVQVLKPDQAISAVVKGAVYFGHDPKIFRKRVCRHTYGIKINMPFDRTLDPKGLLQTDENGVEYCKNRFSKHVSIGEKIKVGTFNQGKIYLPFRENQKSVSAPVYVSKDRNPRYADNSCAYLGSCKLDLSNLPMEEEEIEVSMKFGETELATVKAREVKTNKEIQAELYFLG